MKSLFLNHYLYFLIYESENITVHTIDNQGYATRVIFSAPLEENGVIVRDCENCEIFLDNTSGAVLKLKTTLIERSNATLENERFQSGKKGTTRTTAFTQEISFVWQGNKLRLNKLHVQIMADVQIEGVITPVIHEQSVYVTKVLEGKRIPKNKRINLYKYAFYERIPKLMSSNPNILLTKEEMKFISE